MARLETMILLLATLWASQAALLGYFAGKAFAEQTWVAFLVAFAVTGAVALIIAVREKRSVRREREEAERQARETAPPEVIAPRPRGEM